MMDAKVNGTAPGRDEGTLPSSAANVAVADANGNSANGNGANGNGADINGFALSNLAFAEDLYFQFLRDPGSVEPAWRAYFQGLDGANGAARTPGASIPPAAFTRSIFATAPAPKIAEGNPTASRTSVRLLSERVQRLVEAYRELGHLNANLDPLGLLKRTGAPVRLEDQGLAEEDLDLVFSSENVAGPDRTTLRDLVGLLRETYTRQIGVELSHLHDVELRGWLLESHGAHAQPPRAHARRSHAPARAGHRRRGLRAVPPEQVPRRQALLDGGRREPHPAARAPHRARRAVERRRDRHRHGAPRAPQRARERAQEAARRRSSPSSSTSRTRRRTRPRAAT